MANNDIDNTNLSLKKLLSTFQGIATAHAEIQSFGSGDATYIGGSTIKQYPLLWVDYLPSQFTENSITYNVRVIVSDLIENGESDLANRRHDTISILKDVFIVLSQAYDLDVNFNATAYPFQDDKVDKITGWYSDIAIDIPNTYTLCDVPLKSLISGSGGFVFPGTSGNGVSIYVASSPSITLFGNGTAGSPVSGTVNISSVPGNSLSVNSDGLYASAGTLAGTFATTASFNAFTSSYTADSASFNTRINNVTGSGGTTNTGSLLLTSSFQAYTASNDSRVSNVYASESNYLPTASFNTFSSSYVVDSASLLTKISNATYNPGQLNAFSASILNYTGSINTQIANVYSSESNYLPTASFNTFSGSYHSDSASFDSRINSVGGGYNPAQLNAFSASILTYTGSVNTQLVNIFASQSNYTPTSSFNTVSSSLSSLSASVFTFSASEYTKVNNIFASESNYTPTASFNTFSASYVVDSASLLTKITNATYNPSLLNAFSASILTYTSSVNTQITNVFASESNYLPTASFNTFSSSYVVDSASLLTKISNATFNPAQLNSFTSSIQTQVTNVFASESNYTPTSSFNSLSSSYHTDSASFDSRINGVAGGYNPSQLNNFSASILTFTSSINVQVANVYASESNYLPTASFTGFSASYVVDSASFNTRINSAGGSTNTGSLLLTSSFNAYTGSTATTINNVFASESNYTPTSSFNTFSASYVVDSASFLTKINAATYSPTQLNSFSASILTYTGSETAARINVFASQSNYTLTSSFNTFSASYVVDSASFLTKITNAAYNPGALNAFSASVLTYTSSVNTQLTNIFASESNYTPTSSFNTLSSSYHTDSASFYTNILNVFASESRYVPTASYNPFTASYFTDSASFNTRINSAGGGSSNLPFTTQNNSYTLVLGDANTGILMNSGSAMTLTIPSSSTVNFPTGSQIVIEQAGAGAVSLSAVAGVTLQGAGLITQGQFTVIVLIKQASDTWFVGSPDISLSGNNTWTGNQLFTAGALDLGAGTVSQPALTFVTASAVLMTASQAGDMEVDTNGIQYYTYSNGSRGVTDSEQFVALTGSFTMVSQTAAQRMFPTTIDELNVRANTSYFFETLFTLSALSVTAGTFGFNLSGSATLTSQGWTAFATKAGALATPLNVSSSFTYNTAANTALTTLSVVTTGMAKINGIIRTNAAGTLVPAISLSSASAAVVGANSYFRIWPVGTGTVQSIGNFS